MWRWDKAHTKKKEPQNAALFLLFWKNLWLRWGSGFLWCSGVFFWDALALFQLLDAAFQVFDLLAQVIADGGKDGQDESA
jgi:hypothetical protein